MFVFTRCLLYAEVSQGARTAFAEKTLMEEPPEEVVSEVSPDHTDCQQRCEVDAGQTWQPSTLLSKWFLDRRHHWTLLFRNIPDLPIVVQGRKNAFEEIKVRRNVPAPVNVMAKTPFRGSCPSHVPRASTKHAREGTEQCLPTSLGRVAQ